MGLPDAGTVLKYDMSATSSAGVSAMSSSKQTLAGASVTQADGWTTVTFEKLLVEVYGSEQPPPFDTSTFLSLVDSDNDGKISFQEFDSFVDDKLMATCR